MGKLNLEDRFWSKATQVGECLLWTASVHDDGYGKFSIQVNAKSVTYRAHRVAYALSNGIGVDDIPKGMFVCHTCDTPACVAPAHLWLGTQSDNEQDKVSKGRWRLLREKESARVKSIKQNKEKVNDES